MLDLGANVFCDAEMLYQFGVMGSVLAEEVDGVKNPRVALLNMGEEDNKGSDHIKLAATKLQQNSEINYTGFIEGNDIFNNKAEVIVCDGFVGNVALKTCEGVARLLYEKLKHISKRNLFAKITGKLLTSTIKKLLKPLNPDQYNGASLIGLRGIVVKSHGNASTKAFFAAIIEAVKETERQVPDKITNEIGTGFIAKAIKLIMYSKIIGTGSYFPEQVRSNADLERMVETTDEWITERTGIKERRIAAEHETSAYMGAEAAKKALEMAGLKATDLDMIVMGTASSNAAFPSAACYVQQYLEVPNIPAFDVAAACSGFIYSLSIADQYIKSGMAKRVLVIGADALSHMCAPDDRSTLILFGDAGGACILEASEEQGIFINSFTC